MASRGRRSRSVRHRTSPASTDAERGIDPAKAEAGLAAIRALPEWGPASTQLGEHRLEALFLATFGREHVGPDGLSPDEAERWSAAIAFLALNHALEWRDPDRFDSARKELSTVCKSIVRPSLTYVPRVPKKVPGRTRQRGRGRFRKAGRWVLIERDESGRDHLTFSFSADPKDWPDKHGRPEDRELRERVRRRYLELYPLVRAVSKGLRDAVRGAREALGADGRAALAAARKSQPLLGAEPRRITIRMIGRELNLSDGAIDKHLRGLSRP